MPRRTASLTRRVLTPVLGIIAVSAAGLAWYLSHNARLQTQDAATDSAVATMVHDVSARLSKSDSGVRLRLYSSHPFPSRRTASWMSSPKGPSPS